jgi:hypothetical protein
MSPRGRPKGDELRAKREGNAMSPPGRPKGDDLRAKREGNSMTRPQVRQSARRAVPRAMTSALREADSMSCV